MISVIIGTYGSIEWRSLASERAYPSAAGQTGPWEIICVHGDTLADARNKGGMIHATEPWLCFLDADDELASGYLQAMADAIEQRTREQQYGPTSVLFTPQVEYILPGGRRSEPPKFWPEVPPEQGNWLVIGTVVPRALFMQVGGFEEWAKYEDWALFARMQKAGAEIVKVPGAVYRAHRNPRGRNHEGGTTAAREAYAEIRRAVFPELYEEATA